MGFHYRTEIFKLIKNKQNHFMMIILPCVFITFFPRKSIFQKLYDLYVEECEKEPEVKVNKYKFSLLLGFGIVVEGGSVEHYV